MRGTVKWFNSQKGYGFITREDGIDYFVHYSNIKMDGYRSLEEGDIVEFEVTMEEMNPKRIHAINVQPILTVKSIIASLKKENLMLKTITDSYGVKKYLVVNADDVLQTDENGMTLEELAGYAGLHYPM